MIGLVLHTDYHTICQSKVKKPNVEHVALKHSISVWDTYLLVQSNTYHMVWKIHEYHLHETCPILSTFFEVFQPIRFCFFHHSKIMLMWQIPQIMIPHPLIPYSTQISRLFCCVKTKNCCNSSLESASTVFIINSLQLPPGSCISDIISQINV